MLTKPRPPRPKPPLESTCQRAVVQLFRACGGIVYQTSQGYRRDPGGTRMTPGLPDLVVFWPRHGLLFFEVKRPGGKRTVAQERFEEMVLSRTSLTTYRWGGLDEAKILMRDWGLLAAHGEPQNG